MLKDILDDLSNQDIASRLECAHHLSVKVY